MRLHLVPVGLTGTKSYMFSTGLRHEPVIKNLDAKKLDLDCFSRSSPILSPLIFLCTTSSSPSSSYSVLQEQRKKMTKQLWKEKWEQKRRGEEPEKLHLDYNSCHHSTPRVAGHDSNYCCKSGTSVYWFPFSKHVTCTVQYLTNERILTDIETAISKDDMNMTNKKIPTRSPFSSSEHYQALLL